MSEQPCWPECKEMLQKLVESEAKLREAQIERVEAILDGMKEATTTMATNIISTKTAEMERAFVLQAQHTKDIDNITTQLSGPLGMELRIRALEQSRGVVDAKLYMIIVGIPIAVSFIVSLILPHFMK